MSAPSSGSSGRRWRVALVHSSSAGTSLSSLHNALYLALCLQHSRIADVALVSENRHAGSTADLLYLPPGEKTSRRQCNDSIDCLRLQDLAALAPDLILLVLNPGDMERVSELLLAALASSSKRVKIINLLRGVHEDFVLSDKYDLQCIDDSSLRLFHPGCCWATRAWWSTECSALT